MYYMCYDHTYISTYAGISNINDNYTFKNNVNFIEKICTLKAIKSYFKTHMKESYTCGHFI